MEEMAVPGGNGSTVSGTSREEMCYTQAGITGHSGEAVLRDITVHKRYIS